MFNTIVNFACICYVSVCIWRIKYYYYYYTQHHRRSVFRNGWTITPVKLLPSELRQCDSLGEFKPLLKTNLFLWHFRHFAFLSHPSAGLGATYDFHVRLIGKRVVDFHISVNWTFSLGVTAEALRANIGSKSAISLQRGPVDPKFQVEGVIPTNQTSYQKTRLSVISYDVKIWTDLFFVLSQSTRLTDRRTDRQTDGHFSHR